MEVRGTAKLVDSSVLDLESRAITTTVSRYEIDEVLRIGGDSAEFFLDVARAPMGDFEHADTSSVTVLWLRRDLEELLGKATGDSVTLAFDREELAEAIDPDVEAQGLRDRALILTVAATAAVGTAAGVASGYVADPGGGAATAQVSERGDFVTDTSSSGLGAAAASARGDDFVTDVSSGGPVGAPADRGDFVTDASTGGPMPIASSSDEGGISIPEPAGAALLAGGLALMITGAGFAVRHRGRLRPA